MERERYAGLHRLIHWLMAILVLGMLASGFLIWFYGFEGVTRLLGEANRNLLYKYHKTFGIIVLGLMLLRILVRIGFGVPSHRGRLSSFEKDLSGAVHAYLYLALIAMPVVGWLATDISGYPVEFFETKIPSQFTKDAKLGAMLYDWHAYIGFTLLGLVGLHIAGALRHWLIKRDHVMGRMGLF